MTFINQSVTDGLPEVAVYEFYFVIVSVSISCQISKKVTFFSSVFMRFINWVIKQSKNLFKIYIFP